VLKLVGSSAWGDLAKKSPVPVELGSATHAVHNDVSNQYIHITGWGGKMGELSKQNRAILDLLKYGIHVLNMKYTARTQQTYGHRSNPGVYPNQPWEK
jgi:hypothetical protein